MKYRGDISPEEYAAMEDGFEQGLTEASHRRHRPKPGTLLLENDLRVQAALKASRGLVAGTDQFEPDWRDVAEIVNAVLAADDRLAGL